MNKSTKLFQDNKEESFPTLQEVYKKSKIDYNDYIDECIVLSVETSNSLIEIEKLPFYKFRALTRSLNKYLTAKNKTENGNEANEQQNNMMKNSSDMMNKAKGMMGKQKMPKLK